MKLNNPKAVDVATELTLSAMEHNMIYVTTDDSPEEAAKKVLTFFNTIADALSSETLSQEGSCFNQ